MDGSTGQEAQSLDSKPHDASADVPGTRPGVVLVKSFDKPGPSRGPRASKGLEGDDRGASVITLTLTGLCVSQPPRWLAKIVNAVCPTIPNQRSRYANPDTTEGCLAIRGAHRRNIFGTNEVFYGPFERERPERAYWLDPFILSSGMNIGSIGINSVTAAGQNTRLPRGLASLSGLAPLEETSLLHQPNPPVSSLVGNRLALLSGPFGIIPSLLHNVVSPAKLPVGTKHVSMTTLGIDFNNCYYNTPVIAVACAPVRALRIASGITASGAATAVIPLRTIDGVPSWAWISDYAVWMMCFVVYLTMQVHHIPGHRDHRRQLYLFLVILLAIHFGIALAQSSPTLVEGFTVFGPIVLTVAAFLVGLLLGAIPAMGPRGDGGNAEEDTADTPPHQGGIVMAALSASV
ncbi:hypothetical protein ACHAPT_006304 [Fusarium lateritium]